MGLWDHIWTLGQLLLQGCGSTVLSPQCSTHETLAFPGNSDSHSVTEDRSDQFWQAIFFTNYKVFQILVDLIVMFTVTTFQCFNMYMWNQMSKCIAVGRQWLTPVILATQEAEIRRIVAWSQPRQIVCKTQSWKHPSLKGGMVEWLKV
jgi:hypothetical protein